MSQAQRDKNPMISNAKPPLPEAEFGDGVSEGWEISGDMRNAGEYTKLHFSSRAAGTPKSSGIPCSP